MRLQSEVIWLQKTSVALRKNIPHERFVHTVRLRPVAIYLLYQMGSLGYQLFAWCDLNNKTNFYSAYQLQQINRRRRHTVWTSLKGMFTWRNVQLCFLSIAIEVRKNMAWKRPIQMRCCKSDTGKLHHSRTMWTVSLTSTQPIPCDKKNTVAHRTMWTGLIISITICDNGVAKYIVFLPKMYWNLPWTWWKKFRVAAGGGG